MEKKRAEISETERKTRKEKPTNDKHESENHSHNFSFFSMLALVCCVFLFYNVHGEKQQTERSRRSAVDGGEKNMKRPRKALSFRAGKNS